MNNNLYNSPESDLLDEQIVEERIVPYTNGFDGKMKASIGILVVINILLIGRYLFFPESKVDILNVLVGFIFSVLQTVFIIYAIRRLRSDKIIGSSSVPKHDSLGVWGYIWRYFICNYISLFIIAGALTFSGMSSGFEAQSVGLMMIFSILVFPVSLVLVWTFFSRNRKEQLRWLLSIFRGY